MNELTKKEQAEQEYGDSIREALCAIAKAEDVLIRKTQFISKEGSDEALKSLFKAWDLVSMALHAQ